MTDPLAEDTLAAARRGDPAAVRAVYDALSPRVSGYLTARGATDPEGLTSEVFLTVFARLRELSGGVAGLRTFTFSVAHARLVDDLRGRSRRAPQLPYSVDLDARTSASAEQVALSNLGSGELLSAMAALSSDQREAVALRIVADLSLEETAQIMGRSAGAVKQLQRRGLLSLRQALVGGTVTP